MASGFHWTINTLHPGILEFPAKVEVGIAAVMSREATISEANMKSDAPWNDQTGAARNGLSGKYELDGTTHRITLSHGVDYGIWLELMQSGRFAAVTPEISAASARIQAALTGLLATLGAVQ